jgi:hypothetical protein
MKPSDIDNRFTYHSPAPGQPEVYAAIRAKAKGLAHHLNAECPDGREKSLAITHIEEAVFWANAAIARAEPVPATDLPKAWSPRAFPQPLGERTTGHQVQHLDKKEEPHA